MTENQIQKAIFDNFRRRAAKGVFAFHPKNGGIHQRGRRSGINTGMGVIPGLPDIVVIHDGKVAGLELKTEKGVLSDTQISTHLRLIECGCTVHVSHGLSDALAWLEARGFLKGRAA